MRGYNLRTLYYTPHTVSVDQFLKDHIRSKTKTVPNYKILHLTPTLILFRKRNKDYMKLFRRQAGNAKNGQVLLDKYVKINEFFHWAKEIVYSQNIEIPLSKSESHVLVKRAIAELYPNQLEWSKISFDLLELFLELQTIDLKDAELKNISPYFDWQQLIAIYKKYNELLVENQLMDFSQVLINLLKEDSTLKEFTEVIFDGPFLFFQPVHELLIERCEQLNIPITFIVPFEKHGERINPAYRVIEKAYSCYVPFNEWKSLPSYRSRSTFIEKLPQVIFTQDNIKIDETLNLSRYQTLEQEIREVVTEIKQKIDQEHTSLNKVAIVTPNSMKIRPMVREISENIGLEVEIPERPFLGLSVGEFILIIYQTKIDERKFEKESYLDVSMFRRIISSSWFPHLKETIASFQAIEEVFFDQVVSLNEWESRLNTLLSIKNSIESQSYIYHPIHSVSCEHLKAWLDVIEELSIIQKYVFSEKLASLGQHGKNLLKGLNEIVSRIGIPEEDDDFLQRMYSIVEGISTQNRILVEPKEFGELLYSLFLEQEDQPEGLEQEEYNPENDKSRGILVTSLQNIAFQEYNFIYPIQFTQNNYPKPEKSSWPVHHDIKWNLISQTTQLKLQSSLEFDRLLADREKFYFYLSFLSSKIGYSLSYSRYENGNPQYPSHFLNDIANSIGIKEENVLEGRTKNKKKIDKLLIEKNILKDHTFIKECKISTPNINEKSQKNNITFPEQFMLEDLALYKLCPKRFYYKIEYPNQNVYSNKIQLTFYLANEIYHRGIKRLLGYAVSNKLVEDFERKNVQNQFLTQIKEIIQQESVLLRLFPVSEEIRTNVIFFSTMFLEELIGVIFTDDVFRPLKEMRKFSAELNVDLVGKKKELTIPTEQTIYKIIATRDFSIQFGVARKRSYSTHHRIQFLNISKYNQDSQNNESDTKFNEWLSKLKREIFYPEHTEKIKFEIKEILSMIEQKEFIKNKGSHCIYCPFHKNCLEKEKMTDEQMQLQIEGAE